MCATPRKQAVSKTLACEGKQPTMANSVNKSELLTSFDAIYNHLVSTYNYPLLPNPSPKAHDSNLSHAICSLSAHPTLEAILHILNADLPSAHFLCRHMQNAPAWEGMYVHGLLHRVEGDYENAKAWYASVHESECFARIWGEKEGLHRAHAFIDDLRHLKQTKAADVELKMNLQQESSREIDALVDWCKERFGTMKVEDATQVWVEPSEEHREMAKQMIVGGEGWRKF